MESSYRVASTCAGDGPSPCSSEENDLEIEQTVMDTQFDDDPHEAAYSPSNKRDRELDSGLVTSTAAISLNASRALYNDDNEQSPILPRVNCPEKIVLCLDVSAEMEQSVFRLGDGSVHSSLIMAKRACEIFVHTKHHVDSRHEFALVLLKDSAVWVKDFVDGAQEISAELHHHIKDTKNCQSMNMSSLFDIIAEKVNLPDIAHPEVVPPPYVVRAIFIYGRSQCVPEFSYANELQKFLMDSNYFFLDIFYLHETPTNDNKCEEIYQTLCDLDTRGKSYVFEVGRNPTRLYDAMAKLLAHPLQRPLQKDCQYKINPTPRIN